MVDKKCLKLILLSCWTKLTSKSSEKLWQWFPILINYELITNSIDAEVKWILESHKSVADSLTCVLLKELEGNSVVEDVQLMMKVLDQQVHLSWMSVSTEFKIRLCLSFNLFFLPLNFTVLVHLSWWCLWRCEARGRRVGAEFLSKEEKRRF